MSGSDKRGESNAKEELIEAALLHCEECSGLEQHKGSQEHLFVRPNRSEELQKMNERMRTCLALLEKADESCEVADCSPCVKLNIARNPIMRLKLARQSLP